MKSSSLDSIIVLALAVSACTSGADTGTVGAPESLEEGAANKAAGDAFLAENADKPGVTVLDSGLQYEVLEEGNGASPLATDEVTVHYHGTLIDGTMFDSSIEKGTPATFPLNGVISGWTEGVQLMKVGSKYRFFIPAELGYGPRGQGAIGPNSTLIFEVELLAINGQS
jgi:FKBP-type peptidyl-prolyl cis-trans isomerase